MIVHRITSNKQEDVGCELRVERTIDPYVGLLVISEKGVDKVVERVVLAFGAKFGPDVQDAKDWEYRFQRYLDEERIR